MRAFLALVLLASLFCRFTVRDVGFVDLGDPGYRLYVYARQGREAEKALALRLEELGTALLLDSNVELVAIDPEREPEHPAAKYLGQLQLQELPAAILQGPDERLLEWSLPDPRTSLESLVTSPAREEILAHLPSHFCVVVLVLGSDEGRNLRARAEVDRALAELAKVFDRMPKDVGELPHLLTIEDSQREEEQLLLWRLALPPTTSAEPAAAVLFGRGRQVGPTLMGATLEQQSLFSILALAGQDCECGLDRSYMRGLRLPLRWDAETRARAAKLLGFDPDNPMIKAEVSGILGQGRRASPKATGKGNSLEDLITGYSEETFVEEGEPAAHEEETGETGEELPLTAPLAPTFLLLAGLVLSSLLGGAFLLLRRRP